MMTVTREMLCAYADGELAGAEQARVEAAIAADPELARQVERHRAVKAQLGAHYAPVLQQPVPDRLAGLLGGDPADRAGIVNLAAERHRRGRTLSIRRWAPIAGPALAASLVLALWQPWQRQGTPQGYAEPELAEALETQLVATQGLLAQPRILLSFRSEYGQLCRAWRGDDTGGIACHDDVGWKIEREFALGSRQTTEYRQAGSVTDILAAAQEMSVGEALDAVEEAEAKDRGWR